MISSAEVRSIMQRFPRFEDSYIGLNYAPRIPKGAIKETKKVVAYARKFNDEVVRPNALPLDRKTHEDPDYLPSDLMQKANEWGLYTLWVPKLFGGQGMNLPSLAPAAEELATGCLGIANVICAHYLGLTSLMTSFNMRVTNRVLKDTIEGERKGKPNIIAFAITEPGAGTDVEDVDLVDRGKVVTSAKRVDGGYVINGRKVFISMGHVAEWTVFYAYTDIKKPSQSMIGMVVRTGTKGFSMGRHEDKMGQRVCPASEIIFEDCFIPDDQVLLDSYTIKKYTDRSQMEVMQRHFDYISSTSKVGICAFGVGVARAAFEEALKFAIETEIKGRLLVNHEWVQGMLAEMYKNIVMGRIAYMEANYANSHRGVFETLQMKPSYYYLKFMPASFFKILSPVMMDKGIANWVMSKIYLDWKKNEDVLCVHGMSSLVKFAGTDIAVRNCQLAMDLMGEAGLRHDRRMEKHLRDAKLLQIYDGSNQMCRLTMFKYLIAPEHPQIRVFEEGEGVAK